MAWKNVMVEEIVYDSDLLAEMIPKLGTLSFVVDARSLIHVQLQISVYFQHDGKTVAKSIGFSMSLLRSC